MYDYVAKDRLLKNVLVACCLDKLNDIDDIK